MANQVKVVACMWSPGFDLQACPGQAAIDQAGLVLELLHLVLDDADQPGCVVGGEVDYCPLRWQRPAPVRAWQ